MDHSRTHHLPSTFAMIAAALAMAFAFIGALIILGAGPTPVGRVMTVLVGFLLLGAGAVLALSMVLPGQVSHRTFDEWRW